MYLIEPGLGIQYVPFSSNTGLPVKRIFSTAISFFAGSVHNGEPEDRSCRGCAREELRIPKSVAHPASYVPIAAVDDG